MSYALVSRKAESAAPDAKPKRGSTSLEISEPGDSLEQDADRMAEEVMAGGAARKPEWSLSAMIPGVPVRRSAGADGPQVSPPVVHEALLSPGKPLDRPTRSFMEPRFGHDFSRVRIHTDARACESARAVNALAYTVGRDIVFGAGQYSPASSAGQRLLAHELAHFVQQGAGAPLSGRPALTAMGGAASPRLQRQTGGGRSAPLLVNVPQLRSEIRKRGNPDLIALIDAFPDHPRNGSSFTLPDSVLNGPNPVGGTNHKFVVTFAIIPGEPPLMETKGAGVGDATPKPAAPAAPTASTDPFRAGYKPPAPATVTHPITFTMYEKASASRNYNPSETLFHELIHLRLIIDSYLPLDRRSGTGKKYGRMLTVATEGENVKAPQVLAPPKDVAVGGPRRNVLAKIDALRNWFTSWLHDKFDSSKAGTDDSILEFLVNEKFANQSATAESTTPTSPGGMRERSARCL